MRFPITIFIFILLWMPLSYLSALDPIGEWEEYNFRVEVYDRNLDEEGDLWKYFSYNGALIKSYHDENGDEVPDSAFEKITIKNVSLRYQDRKTRLFDGTVLNKPDGKPEMMSFQFPERLYIFQDTDFDGVFDQFSIEKKGVESHTHDLRFIDDDYLFIPGVGSLLIEIKLAEEKLRKIKENSEHAEIEKDNFENLNDLVNLQIKEQEIFQYELELKQVKLNLQRMKEDKEVKLSYRVASAKSDFIYSFFKRLSTAFIPREQFRLEFEYIDHIYYEKYNELNQLLKKKDWQLLFEKTREYLDLPREEHISLNLVVLENADEASSYRGKLFDGKTIIIIPSHILDLPQWLKMMDGDVLKCIQFQRIFEDIKFRRAQVNEYVLGASELSEIMRTQGRVSPDSPYYDIAQAFYKLYYIDEQFCKYRFFEIFRYWLERTEYYFPRYEDISIPGFRENYVSTVEGVIGFAGLLEAGESKEKEESPQVFQYLEEDVKNFNLISYLKTYPHFERLFFYNVDYFMIDARIKVKKLFEKQFKNLQELFKKEFPTQE